MYLEVLEFEVIIDYFWKEWIIIDCKRKRKKDKEVIRDF